jgi:hypothetical protein
MGASETSAVQALMRNRNVRLMSFPLAEAFTHVFPNLTRLVLPEGVIDLAEDIPRENISLIATTTRAEF